MEENKTLNNIDDIVEEFTLTLDDIKRKNNELIFDKEEENGPHFGNTTEFTSENPQFGTLSEKANPGYNEAKETPHFAGEKPTVDALIRKVSTPSVPETIENVRDEPEKKDPAKQAEEAKEENMVAPSFFEKRAEELEQSELVKARCDQRKKDQLEEALKSKDVDQSKGHWLHDTREDESYTRGFVYLRGCTCSICGAHSAIELKMCPKCRSQMNINI